MSHRPAPDALAPLVAAAHPELAGAPITFLGDGCDHDNYLVGEDHVLRLPKDSKVEARLVAEIALLGRLDVTLDTPRPRGPFRHAGHPFRYAMYPYLPGVPGDVAETIDEPRAAIALGRLLAELQAFDPEEALALGVRDEADPVRAWMNTISQAAKDVPDVLSRLPADVLDSARLPRGRRVVLVHDDLGGEHVLVDPDNGQVTAVIDWADAAVGDPALDYAGLLGWRGEAFLIHALDSAAIAYDDADLIRARFFATAVAIHSIALGRTLGKPRWIAAGERMIARVESQRG